MAERRYRLLDTIDWEHLNGRQVRLEVSPHYIIGVTKEGELIQLARALRERPPAPRPVKAKAVPGGEA
jgi:hypothetical protein